MVSIPSCHALFLSMSASLIFNFWYTPSVCCNFNIYVYARTLIEQPPSYRWRRYCTNCTIFSSITQLLSYIKFFMCKYSCVCVCERPFMKNEYISRICLKCILFKVRSKGVCWSSLNSCITWVVEFHPVILSVFYPLCF